MRIFVILLYSSIAFGHGGEDHSKDIPVKIVQEVVNESAFIKINSRYLSDIKPIFKKSCFDCHSSEVKYPWYYKVPGIKQLIDSDIAEAKEHVDFSNDFPFVSHESPVKDLESIKQDILEGEMPPFKYRIMHSDKILSLKDKENIINWVDDSLEIIKND